MQLKDYKAGNSNGRQQTNTACLWFCLLFPAVYCLLFAVCYFYFTPRSSMSKMRVEFPGMSGGLPAGP
jgi:hypothetical protein